MTVIDKVAAAERMVVSAILMSERNDDPLAIHVVAASALNVLRDLIKSSGDNYVAQVLQQGLFAAAKAHLGGTPLSLPINPEMQVLIEKLAQDIDAGKVCIPSDLTVNLTGGELHAMLNYITKPFNFLKHADNDPLATLDESDFDPKGAIGHALTALTMVCPKKSLPVEIKPYLEKYDLI
jgi:hypothetical protein